MRAQAQHLQPDLAKLMRRFGRPCRGPGKGFVSLVRQTATQLLAPGQPVVSLSAPWDGYRVPRAFRLVNPTGSKGSQAENALLRELLQEVGLPAGGKRVVGVAEAASPSRAHRPASQARHWVCVLACPRTWKLANGQPLRALVPPWPLQYYRQVRVPLVVPRARRRVCWTVAQRAELRPVGDGTVGLSRRRRTDSPKHPNLRVTTLPQATAHLTVALDLRWPVELCSNELKSVGGVGHSQVTQAAARVERAVAVARMASLLLLRLRANQIQPGTSWSAFTLTPGLAWDWGARQVTRAARQEARREVRLRPPAQEVQVRLAA